MQKQTKGRKNRCKNRRKAEETDAKTDERRHFHGTSVSASLSVGKSSFEAETTKDV
jgi:hypothetical protein